MLNLTEFIKSELETSVQTKLKVLEDRNILESIAKISEAVIRCYKAGGKTLLAGNGASASDAQHIASDLVSRFYFDRPGLASLSLSSDPSIVTAIGNDYGYENLFARQIEAHGKAGDVFIGFTTSGRSPNILKAAATAKQLGIVTVAMTSEKGAEFARSCDLAIQVPSSSAPKIQECHVMIGHAILASVEEALFRQ